MEEELLLDVELDEELEFDLLRDLGRVCDFEPSGSTLNLCRQSLLLTTFSSTRQYLVLICHFHES